VQPGRRHPEALLRVKLPRNENSRAPHAPYLFTGKGGVGKTSASCAVAVSLADAGKKVLLVSTDPASNIDEVFATPLERTPTPIAEVPGLDALNVDPRRPLLRTVSESWVRTGALLPADAVASIEEQLSGACTVEIAAFDEFAKLIGDPQLTAMYEHIVFDTAPTGHTLRLLALPAAWTGFLGASAAGTSCLGPLQGMLEQKALYASAVAALSDPAQTTMALVSRPEKPALDEAERTSLELADIGVCNQTLVLNGVFRAQDPADPIAVAMQRTGDEAIAGMSLALSRLDRTTIALKPAQVIGVDALRGFFAATGTSPKSRQAPYVQTRWSGLDALVDDLEHDGRGLIMTMGKGGVGKTTIALADRRRSRGARPPCSSDDHRSGLAYCRRCRRFSDYPHRRRNQPGMEVARYRAEVMATTGAKLDASGLALLKEDLASPCTEEVAVFQAFARTVEQAADGIVVIDTAPTGHTILLLDAAQSYHREVMRQSRNVTDSVRNLLPRLARPGIHPNHSVYACRGHAGTRSGGVAGGPAAGGDRAFRLGHQSVSDASERARIRYWLPAATRNSAISRK
jgi:arsenite-transporting ATPase